MEARLSEAGSEIARVLAMVLAEQHRSELLDLAKEVASSPRSSHDLVTSFAAKQSTGSAMRWLRRVAVDVEKSEGAAQALAQLALSLALVEADRLRESDNLKYEAALLRRREHLARLVNRHRHSLMGDLMVWSMSPIDRDECDSIGRSPGVADPAAKFPEPSNTQYFDLASQAQWRIKRHCDEDYSLEDLHAALAMVQEERLATERGIAVEDLRAAKAALKAEVERTAREIILNYPPGA